MRDMKLDLSIFIDAFLNSFVIKKALIINEILYPRLSKL